MEDWYSGGFGLNNQKKKKKNRRDDEDLEEEQVWGVLKQREDSKVVMRKGKGNDHQIPQWRLHAAPKVIPRATNTNFEGNLGNHHQSSLPVNIPQWSKTYHSSEKGLSLRGDDDDDDDDDDDADDEPEGMVPPHEYIGRRVARSGIASFSMCEGIGRTLKGRDLSKLRNAILTKTGFLE